ncbi:MAG: [protein-PII] uridylyltransferase [Alphaproteobacteria bacterium]|nr:[protein-PII] uridylyltransferase [Alphaproteobacteria bacterium]
MAAQKKRKRDLIDRAALQARIEAACTDMPAAGDRRRIVLEQLRSAIEAGRTMVQTRFEAVEIDGNAAKGELAFLFDQIIRVAHDAALREYPAANPTAGDRMAVVAVGGYGRGELAPFSDIDLLFLFPWKQTAHGEQIVEYILYMLWDLGLKIGHATRSIEDCTRLAKADLTIRTALLEARYLWGDQNLYLELRKTFRDQVMSRAAMDFVKGKLGERDRRHEKMGDSRYYVEPNIKDGKGGLRDLQTLYWIAKFAYEVDSVPDLVARGVLTKAEARNFSKDQNFLWSVRFHLHYLSGRPEERLTFDVQTSISKRMGYADRAGASDVERFMKHYYIVAKDVGDLTRIFCAAIEAENMSKPIIRLPRLRKARDLMGFDIDRDRLTVADEGQFERDPAAMIRLFFVAHNEGLDIHPRALRLVTQNLKRIDKSVREDPDANRMFVEMASSIDAPELALTRMNEAGVFGRFLRDFGRVVGQTQHDMYHVYTVDEHTIQAIGLLAKIERGELAGDHPVASAVIHKIGSRRALYMGVLFHDIAKGRGGDHSVLGARVAKRVCPRLGLDDEESETVEWLVSKHLVMSDVAQKRDLNDSKTIMDFVDEIQSPERLRLLLCLTVVDMRATGPNVWNNWKAELLRELYQAAEDVMSGGQRTNARGARIDAAKEELRGALADWSEADIQAQLERGYPGYWLTFETDTLAHHARLMRAAEKEKLPLSIRTRVRSDIDVTELTVYTQDHPGLFSRITGAIAAVDANIVDAKVFTTPQGMALDTFWLQDRDDNALSASGALERLTVQIERAFAGEMGYSEPEAERTFVPARTKVFSVPPRVIIDNQASATHTVVEVNGRDRPGFLYVVTRVLYDLSLQISSAKISTFGERAVDVFYVKDGFGMKVNHESRIAAIRERLLEAIREKESPATGRDAHQAAE